MLIDLREIIDIPGGRVLFDYEPDLSDAVGGSIIRVEKPARAIGQVSNSAGVLTFSAEVDAVCVCVCAKCAAEFSLLVHKLISAYVTKGGEDGEDHDAYVLQGDMVDADEIIVTEFVLDMEDTLLCNPDCAGLCDKCGADLNEGSCDCKTEIDPRLAALGQLLDNDEEVF
ncbi:MAG: DUF177 domain-containing protein [Oscillospiraceae bacterium]|nr:DUF177 domain-containing protein [Oscillospiraceae bacterium]